MFALVVDIVEYYLINWGIIQTLFKKIQSKWVFRDALMVLHSRTTREVFLLQILHNFFWRNWYEVSVVLPACFCTNIVKVFISEYNENICLLFV